MRWNMKKLAALCLALLLLLVGCTSAPGNRLSTADPNADSDDTESPVLNADNAKIMLFLCDAEMRSSSARALWTVTEKFSAESGIAADWVALPAPDDVTAQLDDILAQGYTIIVNNNGLLNDYIKERSGDYPDVTFVVVEGWFTDKGQPQQIADYPNLVQATVRAEESAFLAGYLMTLASKSGSIGLVGGTANPPGLQMQKGFEAGVAYAEQESGKDVQVSVEYAGNGFNRPGGKEAAARLYNSGCDFIYLCAGGETDWGAIETAKVMGKYCITAGHTSYIAPASVAAEVLKSKDPVVTAIYQDLYYGRPVQGVQDHGLSDGTAGLNKTAISEEVFGAELLLKAEAVIEKIKAGEIEIPQT